MGTYSRIAKDFACSLTILSSISTAYSASLESNRIGHLSDAQTTAGYTLGDEESLLGLRKMGDKLNLECKLATTQCTYRILVDPRINASATPPCYVYITTGLLDFVQSPDELAGIIGHELGHIHENHSEEALNAAILPRAMGSGIVSGVAGAAGTAAAMAIPVLVPGAFLFQLLAFDIAANATAEATGPIAQSLVEAIISGYTREQEFTADVMGARCAATAGYDRRALIGFFERLDKLPNRSSDLTAVSHFLNKEPSLEERKQKLEGAIQ